MLLLLLLLLLLHRLTLSSDTRNYVLTVFPNYHTLAIISNYCTKDDARQKSSINNSI